MNAELHRRMAVLRHSWRLQGFFVGARIGRSIAPAANSKRNKERATP